MKKAIIYCFSGTGNTRRVSDMVAGNLCALSVETEVFKVTREAYRNKAFPNPNEYDLIGIAYPIYGFNAPLLVNKFVKILPAAERGQKAFIVKSSGEPFKFNNSSSSAIKRYLKAKRYDLTYERHYLMPYNIMFRYNDGLVKQMYLYAQELSKVSAAKIVGGSRDIIKPTVLSRVANFICKLVWLGGPICGVTYHVDNSKCVHCNKCVKSCPAQNIKVNKKGNIKFGGHCMMCCSCSMGCPTDAIGMGIMNGWKVNGAYPFEKVVNDESISANFVNLQTKGYFKKFNKYYAQTDKELLSFGIVPPRVKFAPNEYAVMSKKQKKQYNKNLKQGK